MESIGAVLKEMAARGGLAAGHGPQPTGTVSLDGGPAHDPACSHCGGKGWYVRDTGRVVPVWRRNPDTKQDERVMVPYCTQVTCSCAVTPATTAVQSPEKAGLGGMLVDKTLACFDPADLKPDDWRALRTWAVGLPGSLSEHAGWLLAGTTGNGKTHLAAGILHRVRGAGVRVRLVEETALIREIQATYSHDDPRDRTQDENAIMDSLITVPLLCLDDLGQGYVPGYADARDGAGWWSSKVYALLDGRLKAGRPTIVTTNMKGAALAARVGHGATSRLDALRLVVFGGKDRR